MKSALTALLVLTATSTFPLLAAPATAFRVTLPDPVISSQGFAFTVEAIDGTGTVDPTYTGRVMFSSNVPIDVLPQSYTFTAGDAGAHTFSAELRGVGNHTISVFDVANSSIGGSDTTMVRYGPDATQRFVVDAPATGTLGTPFSFTVTATDMNGTPTPEYTGTVRFKVHGTTQPPDSTFTAADQGVKTFSSTPDRGDRALLTVEDIAYTGISGTASVDLTCPGFTVSASNDGPVCPDQEPTLTATTAEPGVLLEWSGPRGFYKQGATVTGRAGWAGEYIVTMRTPNGCTASATTSVAVNSVYPSVTSQSGPGCDGRTRTLSISDSEGPYSGIVWAVEHGSIVSGQGTPTVTIVSDYDASGPKWQDTTLFLTATNAAGCFIDHRSVHSFSTYPKPTVTIDMPSSVCPGPTHNAAAIIDDPFGPAPLYNSTFVWSITNGTIVANEQDHVYFTITGDGPSVLTLAYANALTCEVTTTATITPDGASATIASSEPIVCAGAAVDIPVVLTGTAPFTVTWSDGHVDHPTTTSFTRSVIAQDSALYSIASVTDASGSGCSQISGSVFVSALDAPAVELLPADLLVPRGGRTTLGIAVEPGATSVQWYRGEPGDRSNPVAGATSTEFRTPELERATTFWAEAETSCGTATSSGTTVSVETRRRAARHP